LGSLCNFTPTAEIKSPSPSKPYPFKIIIIHYTVPSRQSDTMHQAPWSQPFVAVQDLHGTSSTIFRNKPGSITWNKNQQSTPEQDQPSTQNYDPQVLQANANGALHGWSTDKPVQNTICTYPLKSYIRPRWNTRPSYRPKIPLAALLSDAPATRSTTRPCTHHRGVCIGLSSKISRKLQLCSDSNLSVWCVGKTWDYLLGRPDQVARRAARWLPHGPGSSACMCANGSSSPSPACTAPRTQWPCPLLAGRPGW
jgi:hypothetical protein